MKPILVGESNPYGADPYYALYPIPSKSAGGRLCHRILGMSEFDYMRSFDRYNLHAGKWDAAMAKLRAKDMLAGCPGATFILLGKKVADAFDCGDLPEFHFVDRSAKLVRLPHPSGRCMSWNRLGAIDEGRRLLVLLLPSYVSELIGSAEKVSP